MLYSYKNKMNPGNRNIAYWGYQEIPHMNQSYQSGQRAQIPYYQPPGYEMMSQYMYPSHMAPSFIPQEDFPSLRPSYGAAEFRPPGFSRAINPDAVSFVPMSSKVPSREEQELDAYGVKGMLPLKKTSEDLQVLSRGQDLTRLGLNMKSEESLSSHFKSPFDAPDLAPAEEPEYSLPSCYFISKPILRMKLLSCFSLGTLFYIFYNMPGEILQALAAEELYKRKWVFEANRQLWFSKETGKWQVFDTTLWESVPSQEPDSSVLNKEDIRVKKQFS